MVCKSSGVGEAVSPRPHLLARGNGAYLRDCIENTGRANGGAGWVVVKKPAPTPSSSSVVSEWCMRVNHEFVYEIVCLWGLMQWVLGVRGVSPRIAF